MTKKITDHTKVDDLMEQYDRLTNIVDKFITGERKERVLKLLEDFSDEIIIAPASTKESFFNCFPGGALEHMLNTIKSSLILYGSWREAKFRVDFTREELIMVGIFHNFGKFGDGTDSYYIPTSQQWQIRKGILYEVNNDITFMKVPERALFILQKYEIELSENEYLGIKMSDGFFDDEIRRYFTGDNLHTTLPLLIHISDWMTSLKEKEQKKKKKEEENKDAVSKLKSLL